MFKDFDYHIKLGQNNIKELRRLKPNLKISELKYLENSKENDKLSEKLDDINKVQGKPRSTICYYTIKSKELENRINSYEEKNILGCSMFAGKLECTLDKVDWDYRNMILHIFNTVKNLDDMIKVSKYTDNNKITNFFKYVDIPTYFIRIYIDHSILIYYLKTTNQIHKKMFDYIFSSPNVELFYYITPLSGKYIIDDKHIEIKHNETFGTIMRLLPLFIEDEVNFKSYHSRDARLGFGLSTDFTFMKAFKDNKYNLFNNIDIYGFKYDGTPGEANDHIYRFSAWVGCKNSIIKSNGIKLLLSRDDIDKYLTKYPIFRISGTPGEFAYGVDEPSRIIKAITLYIIHKIYQQININDIDSLNQICLTTLYENENSHDCKYYYDTNFNIYNNFKNKINNDNIIINKNNMINNINIHNNNNSIDLNNIIINKLKNITYFNLIRIINKNNNKSNSYFFKYLIIRNHINILIYLNMRSLVNDFMAINLLTFIYQLLPITSFFKHDYNFNINSYINTNTYNINKMLNIDNIIYKLNSIILSKYNNIIDDKYIEYFKSNKFLFNYNIYSTYGLLWTHICLGAIDEYYNESNKDNYNDNNYIKEYDNIFLK